MPACTRRPPKAFRPSKSPLFAAGGAPRLSDRLKRQMHSLPCARGHRQPPLQVAAQLPCRRRPPSARAPGAASIKTEAVSRGRRRCFSPLNHAAYVHCGLHSMHCRDEAGWHRGQPTTLAVRRTQARHANATGRICLGCVSRLLMCNGTGQVEWMQQTRQRAARPRPGPPPGAPLAAPRWRAAPRCPASDTGPAGAAATNPRLHTRLQDRRRARDAAQELTSNGATTPSTRCGRSAQAVRPWMGGLSSHLPMPMCCRCSPTTPLLPAAARTARG